MFLYCSFILLIYRTNKKHKGAFAMGSNRKTFDVGRDSKTGQFITVKEAKSHPSTTTVERVPKSGYGDTDRKK